VRRREFIGVLGSVAVARPRAAIAASTDQVRRIVVLMMYAVDDPEGEPNVREFTQGLKEFGWVEGQNVRIDCQWGAADVGRLGDLAKALISHRPDLLLAS
jgi:putative ABC transport system substrate-binding protein